MSVRIVQISPSPSFHKASLEAAHDIDTKPILGATTPPHSSFRVAVVSTVAEQIDDHVSISLH